MNIRKLFFMKFIVKFVNFGKFTKLARVQNENAQNEDGKKLKLEPM